MSVRQYIGARYVPRFSDVNGGVWSNVYSYEPLTIVKNGNDYYTSKQSVPVGIAITNTDYWVKTGDYNGAISGLDDRVSALESHINDAKAHKYVLIGDSFGCGIQGSGLPWVTGWIDYMHNILPANTFYYDPTGDQSFEGTSGFTTVSEKNFIGQLNYVYDNKLGQTAPEEITDVVVLGGSNEGAATETDIVTAINTFCSRSRTLFPNANIKIGVWGLNSRYMLNTINSYKGYKKGALKNGCVFLGDAFLLGCNPTYDSGYGHFTEAGYNKYNPYIAEMVITGHTEYVYYYSYPVTLGSNASFPTGVSFTINIVFEVTNRGIKFKLVDTDRQTGVMLPLNSKITVSNITINDVLLFSESAKMYFPFDLGLGLINTTVYYAKSDGIYHPVGRGFYAIYLDGNRYKIRLRSSFPFYNANNLYNDNNYSCYVISDAVPAEIPFYTGLNI